MSGTANPGRIRTALTLTGLLLLLATGRPADAAPTIEERIRYQNSLLEKGETERCIREFRELSSRDETAENHYLLGRIYGEIGDFPAARSEFERALEIDPLYATASLGLAKTLLFLREFERAMEELRRAVKLDPENQGAAVLLAQLLAERGKMAEAEKRLDGIIEKDPKAIDARLLLARILLATGRVDRALAQNEAVLYLKADHRLARLGLAQCHIVQNRWGTAEEELRRLLEATPRDLDARLMLAGVLARTERAEAARELLREVLQANPEPRIRQLIERELKRIDLLEDGREVATDHSEHIERQFGRLKSEKVKERREAIRRLEQYEWQHLPRAILRCITDEDLEIRVRVARMVGLAGREERIPLLHYVLFADPDEDPLVRGACVEALRKIRSPACVPLLLKALRDESDYVRELALRALRLLCGVRFSELGAAKAVEDDLDAVRGGWWSWWTSPRAVAAKRNALTAIGRIHGKTRPGTIFGRVMLGYLPPLIMDADPAVYEAAHALFVERTGVSLGELRPDPAVRKELARKAAAWVEGERE